MEGEHAVEAAVAEQRAAQRTHLGGRFDPARRLDVELPQLLQRAILRLGQKRDAHRGGRVDDVALGLVALARLPRRAVVAQVPCGLPGFRGAQS